MSRGGKRTPADPLPRDPEGRRIHRTEAPEGAAENAARRALRAGFLRRRAAGSWRPGLWAPAVRSPPDRCRSRRGGAGEYRRRAGVSAVCGVFGGKVAGESGFEPGLTESKVFSRLQIPAFSRSKKALENQWSSRIRSSILQGFNRLQQFQVPPLNPLHFLGALAGPCDMRAT